MMDLITENIEVWTAAEMPQTNGGRGRGRGANGQSPHGIKKLRALILELAVQGKLVEQDPSDEPASILLEKIAKEKSRLIKEGKIKKDIPLPEIGEDEKPFVLPVGWKWARFGNITLSRDAERIPISADERKSRQGEYDYYGASGVIDTIDNYLFDKPLLLIGEDGANLINRSTPIAFMARGKYWVNNHAHVLDGISEELLLYICLHINAISLEPYVTGTAQPKMNQAKMNSIVLALPPLAEQYRIVAKVDELMALCDKLERQQADSSETHQALVETLLATLATSTDQAKFAQSWQRIADHFDTLFTTEASIDQLKQTILQLAVMGKLVEQDPNDEPASALLEKIAKEKAQLIKKGKIKKQKPLPKITEDEKPFELPDGWKWVRLGGTGLGSTGKTPPTGNPKYYGGGTPFLGPGQITPGGVITESDKSLTDDGCEYSVLGEAGDILMVCIGGSIGKSAILRSKVAFNQQINCLSPIFVDSTYLNSAMNTLHFQTSILGAATGSATPIINRSKWEELVVPIPPLAEQHRIVTKVDELMALCDTLKARLHDAQTAQIQLADAIVEQAIAA